MFIYYSGGFKLFQRSNCTFCTIAEVEIEDDKKSEERESEAFTEEVTVEQQLERSEDEREREDYETLRDTDEGLSEDPGLWAEKLTDKQRKTIVQILASEGGAKTGISNILPKDKDSKPFLNYLQYAKSANGREKIKRDWLIYSKSTNALYCIPCLLFSHEQKTPSKSPLNSKDGLKMANIKWIKMYAKLPQHETHAPHMQCYLKWKSLQHSILEAKGVDCHIEREILTEIEKSTMLLERLLDVTIHLASRNLAFRGKNLELDNVHNGNFLGTLELLAHYDPPFK